MGMKIELVYFLTYLCVVHVLPTAWSSPVVVERLKANDILR